VSGTLRLASCLSLLPFKEVAVSQNNRRRPQIQKGRASGLVTVTRFAAYDRKPVIASGDLDAAAMIHDAQNVLSLS